jgi:hypothetical protein
MYRISIYRSIRAGSIQADLYANQQKILGSCAVKKNSRGFGFEPGGRLASKLCAMESNSLISWSMDAQAVSRRNGELAQIWAQHHVRPS